MCLGIFIPLERSVEISRLFDAYKANPDGCGILWITDGRLMAIKGVWEWHIFLSKYQRSVCHYHFWSPAVLHFRMASAAGIGDEFCHPHFVNKNLAFVHNGNFFEMSSCFGNGVRSNDKRTDSQRFNEEVLQKLPDNFLQSEPIRNALELYCQDNMSKMVFLDNQGRATIVNEQAGEWIDGCWFSNCGIPGYAGYGYSGAYDYKSEDVRHKGGLPTIQMFSEKARKNWQQCQLCLGWYLKKEVQEMHCASCQIFLNLKSFCRKEN